MTIQTQPDSEKCVRNNIPKPINSSTVHRIFGSLFGIWTALLLKDNFHVDSIPSCIFIIYALSIIGINSIILHAGFTRDTKVQRYIAYGLLILCNAFLIPGIKEVNEWAYSGKNIFKYSDLFYVLLVLPLWCLFAEICTNRNFMSNQEIQVRAK